MKKIYLTMFVSALVFGANAQQYRELTTKHDANVNAPSNNKPVKPVLNTEKAVPLWENSFDDANDWVFTNTSAPTSYNWVITTTQGDIPNAAPSLQPFMSTSASDGFALINSDGQPGNVDGDGAIVAELTNATPIDLTGYPNVILKFQHSYRWWQEDRGVRVSGDGGTTWTDFPITSLVGGAIANGYPINQNSENPVYQVFNISAVAGGSNNVLVQFYYNDNDIWAWYWTVDDVEILEQPLDDIQILSSWFAGTNNGGIEYGKTPVNHLDDSYLVGSEIYNFGVNDQTNIGLNADFTAFSYNATSPSLLSDATLLLETTNTPALSVGVYNGTYTAVSAGEIGGAEFGNNVYERNFEVTNDMYAVDGIGINPASNEDLGVIGTASFLDAEDGLIVTSLYNIKETDLVSGIRVMLDATTVPGGDIYGSILDTALFWAEDMTPLFSTLPGVVTAGNVTAGYIDLWFANEITLNPGAYYAAVDLYSNAGASDIVIVDDRTVPQPADASAIFISGDQSYSNGTAVGIRLLTGDQWGVGLNEETLAGISVYPNPSTGIVNISNDMNAANTITVHDLSGRVVLTKTADQATTIDLSTVGTGVYTVTVSNELGSMVERVVIK